MIAPLANFWDYSFHATLQVYFLEEPCTYCALCRVFIEHDKIGRRGRPEEEQLLRCVGRRSASISHKSRVFVTQRASERRRKRDVKWTAPSVSAICSGRRIIIIHYIGVVNIANSRGQRGRKAGTPPSCQNRGRAREWSHIRSQNTILAKWFRSPQQPFHIH